MTDHARKTKPELWKEIDFLELKILLLEQYLEKNGLLMEPQSMLRIPCWNGKNCHLIKWIKPMQRCLVVKTLEVNI